MKLLSYENLKLKHQFIFNLPAGLPTCNRVCPGCYALKAEVRFPAVTLSRNRKLAASQQPDFAATIIQELSSTRRSARTVRIQESGDFYSQSYIDSWHTIASTLPQFTFYAFTKRLKHFNFTPIMSLPNVIIIDSLMHSSLNYGKAHTLLPHVFTCPATAGHNVICGVSCIYCMGKQAQTNGLQFVLH